MGSEFGCSKQGVFGITVFRVLLLSIVHDRIVIVLGIEGPCKLTNVSERA